MSTSVKIDDALKARVQRIANRKKRSPNWIMREAIAQYVLRAENSESFRQEAQASWSDYQETGLHLTGHEVHAWLNNWGTEKEEAAPECHE
jgi:predicted transcriptional regulator